MKPTLPRALRLVNMQHHYASKPAAAEKSAEAIKEYAENHPELKDIADTGRVKSGLHGPRGSKPFTGWWWTVEFFNKLGGFITTKHVYQPESVQWTEEFKAASGWKSPGIRKSRSRSPAVKANDGGPGAEGPAGQGKIERT